MKNKPDNNKQDIYYSDDLQKMNNLNENSFEKQDHIPGSKIISKFEGDLFKDEMNIVERVIRVKRTRGKIEKWTIYNDQEAIFVIEGDKLSKKICSFLRTPEGFNYLLIQFKSSLPPSSFSALKQRLTEKINS